MKFQIKYYDKIRKCFILDKWVFSDKKNAEVTAETIKRMTHNQFNFKIVEVLK